jgi:hypothetical protein
MDGVFRSDTLTAEICEPLVVMRPSNLKVLCQDEVLRPHFTARSSLF